MPISKIQANSVADNSLTTDQFASTAVHGQRNLIINGAAQINQRGAIAAGATDAYFADRWSFIHNGTSARSALNTSTDVPSGEGFNKSLKIDVSTADTTPTGTNYMILRQVLEGQDLVRLKKGTSSAEIVTLSFWVKSSVTGTYIAELFDLHNIRQISKAYTVSTANTWEKKIITFPADTSGAFTYDNSGGLSVQWWFLAGGDFTSGTLNDSAWAASTNANRVVGQVNLFASTSNEIYITGVQLEVGEQATPFEHRSYADELARCQRYYIEFGSNGATGCFLGSSFAYVSRTIPQMRATPSITVQTLTGYIDQYGTASRNAGSVSVSHEEGHIIIYGNSMSGGSTGNPAILRKQTYLDAEL